ncbi:unnamed protein product [Camellia sinensis]
MSFVEYGCEGSILLLQTCLDHINFREGDVHNTMVTSEQLLTDFCDELHLSVSEKIGIGLALADSENVEIRTSGQNFCMGQIEELWKNSAVIDSSEQIQNIIMFLIRSEGLSKHVDSFMQLLSLMEPKERTLLILAPLLSDDFYDARNMELFYGCRENEFDAILAEMVSETSMADIMSELGNGCTVDALHCNEVLSLFLPLTEATVSRILGTITRTHTGLEDNQNCCLTLYSAIGSSATCEASCLSSWNVHVLVDLIKQLAPNINWINVVENLDHEGLKLRELVLKDYAMESDETCIYNASHLMVASLAGSLAHVTCKEPLRVSISSQLRNSLQGFNITNEAQEEAVAIVLNDNLDLGCAVIEHAATDNVTIGNEITIQLSRRRKHREGVGPSYYDATMYTHGPMGLIPEAFRPRPGHLSHSQQRVYEDFIQFPWQNQSSQSSNEVPTDVMVSSSDYVGTGVSRACVSPTRQLNPALYSSGLRSMGLSSVAQPVYLISEELDPGSTQLIGGSSTRMGATDGVVSDGAKSNNIASLSSAATAPEQQFLETSNTVKKFLFGLMCISIVWCKELEGAVPPLTAASTTEHMASGISEPLFTTGDALEKYQIVAQKLEMLITEDTGDRNSGLIAQIPEIILKCISRDEAASAVGQKVFKSLYEKASSSLHVSAHIAILASIRDGQLVIYSNEERKFNRDIIVGLIHKDLLNLTEYNMHMAKLIDAGRNKSATEFAISLLQTLLIQESSVSVSELPNLVDVLAKVATRPGASDSLQQLVETTRNPAANAAVLSGFSLGKDDKAKPSREKKGSDNATILTREEYINADSGVSMLFAEWYKIYELHGTNEATCTRFLSQLQQTGYSNGDDMSDRFFRHLMELSVAFCLSTEGISSRSLSFQSSQTSQNLSFLAIDYYIISESFKKMLRKREHLLIRGHISVPAFSLAAGDGYLYAIGVYIWL